MQIGSLHLFRFCSPTVKSIYLSSEIPGFINIISWTDREIIAWSVYCKDHCLSKGILQVNSTTIESPDVSVNTSIPKEYITYHKVFSRTKVSGLLPHRDYDCTIDLLPGTTPPRGRAYPLSCTEQRTMKYYVQEALKQEYIVPSTVEEKDGGLRRCREISWDDLSSLTLTTS